jgi:hypothetical protein
MQILSLEQQVFRLSLPASHPACKSPSLAAIFVVKPKNSLGTSLKVTQMETFNPIGLLELKYEIQVCRIEVFHFDMFCINP